MLAQRCRCSLYIRFSLNVQSLLYFLGIPRNKDQVWTQTSETSYGFYNPNYMKRKLNKGTSARTWQELGLRVRLVCVVRDLRSQSPKSGVEDFAQSGINS